ncbi:HD-domain/PDEase-like protein [Auricularia subglabra TFB-10046 SS5]|nr:HD-domain/PDEase-like protein [Auricularia subglabra TFB-10046 SS5]
MSDSKQAQPEAYSEAFAPTSRDCRRFKDPIYDYIELSHDLSLFIDTPEFQRLHSVKQLGTSCYVWPSASHNRFEHSLGVAYLAGKMIDSLRSAQPGLGITERDKHCVQLAALCHDLGHGPFSHVFDSQFMPEALKARREAGEKEVADAWEHEEGSELMFDELVEANKYKITISEEDVNFVKDLIRGEPRHSTEPRHKMFLFQIVANKRNGIDVDKLDYLARDTWATGEHNTIAHRLIYSARVLEGNICFHVKDAIQVYHLFHSRFNMHKRIYNHKTARAMEYMIVDALLAADPHLKISHRVYDPKKFRTLTDAVVTEIEDWRMEDVPQLAKSREILLRWRRRQLYRAVDFQCLPYAFGINKEFRGVVTAENIVKSARAECKKNGKPDVIAKGEMLQPGHVIVDFALVHWGMKDKNPLDMVDFYGNTGNEQTPKPRKAEPQDLTNSLPREFAEYHLRIYTREPSLFGVIQAGFRELLRQTSLPESPAPHPLDNDDDSTVNDSSDRVPSAVSAAPSREQTPLEEEQGPMRTPPQSRGGSMVLPPAGPVTPKPSRSPPDPSELPRISGNKFMGTPIEFEYRERTTDPGSPTTAAAFVKRGTKRTREPDGEDEDVTPRRRSRSTSATNALGGSSALPGSSGKRKSARLGGGPSSAGNDGK